MVYKFENNLGIYVFLYEYLKLVNLVEEYYCVFI